MYIYVYIYIHIKQHEGIYIQHKDTHTHRALATPRRYAGQKEQLNSSSVSFLHVPASLCACTVSGPSSCCRLPVLRSRRRWRWKDLEVVVFTRRWLWLQVPDRKGSEQGEGGWLAGGDGG